MKIVELIIDENDEFNGVEAISIVENPAIEEDFIALKDEDPVKLAEIDKIGLTIANNIKAELKKVRY